jgi:hypothetical protein
MNEEQKRREAAAKMHQELDQLGVSHSVYGQAGREAYIRQHMGELGAPTPAALHREGRVIGVASNHGVAVHLPSLRQHIPRSDILAILRGHLALSMARPPELAERDMLRALITIFETME